MNPTMLIERLRRGGVIRSSSDFSATEIAIARAGGRMVVDDDGYGYIYVPAPRKPEDRR